MRGGPRRKGGLTPWQRRIAALAIVVLLLVAGYVAVLIYALTIVDRFEVEVRLVRVLSSDADALDVDLALRIGNPSGFAVDTGRSSFVVWHGGFEAAAVDVPAMHLASGDNDVSFRTRMVAVRPNAMRALAVDLMSPGGATVTVIGRVEVKGLLGGNYPVSRTVLLGGGEGVSFVLDRVEINDNPAEGVPVEVNVTVRNPTVLETTLDGLRFDVLHEGVLLHSHFTSGMLLRGDNPMALRFDIGPDRVDAYRPLVAALTSGSDAEIRVIGAMNGNSLLSRLSTAFDRVVGTDAGLGGIEEVSVEIVEAFVNSTGAGISVDAVVVVINPTPLSTTLEGLNFTLSYNGTPLAASGTATAIPTHKERNVGTGPWPFNGTMAAISTAGRLCNGTTRLKVSLAVPSAAAGALEAAIGDAIEGREMVLSVAGADMNGLPLSRLMTSFAYAYAPDLGGQPGIDVADVDLELGLFTTNVTAVVEVDNPTQATVDVGGLRLDAYYGDEHIGEVLLDRDVIVPGLQTVNATVSVGTISLIFLPAWAVDFLAGREMEVLIVATLPFDDGKTLSIERTLTISGR